MALKLSILGCNSAIPTIDRLTTSQVLSTANKNYVIDCGEGAQIRLNQLKIKKNKIHEIFISHLHGDHFFGLPGLITSFNLSGRTLPLKIYGPKGLQTYIDTLTKVGAFYLSFELEIIELEANSFQKIHEDESLTVYTIPLNHRVPTTGFLFEEKKGLRNINPEAIGEFELSYNEIADLKRGIDVLRKDGIVIKSEDHTTQSHKAQTYAYCSDTSYDESLIPMISEVDVLYHEATYLHDLADKASDRMHSTAREAATIAEKANVGKLILGHYSSRYKNLDAFLDEAKAIFSRTELAMDAKVIEF